MTITVSPVPVAPTVAGATICSGSTATLTPTAPGGAYNWYTTATGGSSFFTGSTYTTPSLTANTTYYVSATINGVTGARTAVTVTVTTTAPPVVAVPAVCLGSTASLTATGPAGAVFNWYDAAVNGNYLIGGPTYTTGALNANASFFVDATVNGCTSARTEVDVVVTPLPNITSANASDVCSGAPLNYTITADNAAATFLWSRAAVAGIGNSAVTNQTSANITEMLINNTPNAINVTYIITAIANGCSSTPFNYIVTVYPAPVVTSAATATICNGTSTNYSVSFSVPQTGFTWDRAAVTGISNAAVSGQTAATLHEVLFNTTNAPVNVIYTYNYSAGPCAGTAFNFVVTVNPSVGVTSAANAGVCTGTAQNYIIASNVPSATFNWGRAAVQGISNAAVSNQTSGTITEALINTGTSPVPVQYVITPTAFGCQGAPFSYTVTVNPIPVAPVANGNSPVCVGSTIQLRTPLVANATYLWAGPGGYTSTQQNADITNVTVANTGNYQLFVTINGCTSPPATVAVTVDPPPVANAGPNQTSCISTATVQLAGSVTGGTTTGIWSTAGSGTFLPAENQLNAVYAPSAQDKAAGSVVLTLVSTSKDDCSVSSSNMTITFATVPAADAGPDQTVCAQTSGVTLAGKILIPSSGVWTTSGTGSFAPSASQLNATYVPGAADIAAGSVTLTLTASSANNCYIPADQMVINFIPPPTVYAGGTRYVLKNNTITLTPTVSDPNVTYLWSPNVDISDPTIKNPIVTGNKDRTYTLTVTDVRGCVASDTTRIKVSPAITVNNTFTPNGDGINDTWDIVGLIAYQNATVDIFNRNGTPLFHSIGYPVPWDGTFNNLPVPVGVYFYIINTNVNHIVLSGSVTVIR
jgi:gliding motility-associated-like protein